MLFDLLDNNWEDFGKHIIPGAIESRRVFSYIYQGYWEDIGTIGAFYEANLALTAQPNPAFSFYDEKFPIYTRPRYLPPSKMQDAQVTESIIGDWTSNGGGEASRLRGPSVQSVDAIRADMTHKLPRLRAVAHGLYERWATGLAR